MDHAELARQRAHYAEVRRRLMGAPAKPVIALGQIPPKPMPPVQPVLVAAPPPPPPPAPPPAPLAEPPHITQRRRREDVLAKVAIKHGVTRDEMMSTSRSLVVVRARHEACYLLMKEQKYGYSDLGRIFGKDHTTILHGVRKHCETHGLAIPEVLGSWRYAQPAQRLLIAAE